MTIVKEFGADQELKSLFKLYLVIALFGLFLWWLIPAIIAVILFSELQVGLVATISTIASLFITVGFTLYWIPRFQSSIRYVLEDDEVIVTKGVWWKNKSFVPYNRITNINIYQGPISRHLGLGRLAIQTAGFSGVSGSSGVKTAEAVIFGVKNYEEVKDIIMQFVRGRKPEATETEIEARQPKDINKQMLAELQRIRKALEK